MKPYNGGKAMEEPADYRFKLVPFDQIRFDRRRRYLIKGLIPREGLTIVWGPPKCGKSFWTYDALMHVALGWEYRGRRVQQCPVIYIACEGAGGQGARAEAQRLTYLETYEGPPTPFYLISTNLSLSADHLQLIGEIKAQIGDTMPGAVVLDTLNRSIDGSENDPADMTAYVRAADAIQAAFNCAVVIVHHCGVDGTRPRGHTSLTGAADAQLAVKRAPDKTITVIVEWMKDGPEGDEIHSRLRVVEVGTDEDGDTATSCIVEEAADAPSQSNVVKLSAPCAIALTALRKAIEEGGEPVPPSNHVPANVIGVPIEIWRKFAYAAAITDADTPSARQKAFKRAADQLQARGAIGCWNDWVWPTT